MSIKKKVQTNFRKCNISLMWALCVLDNSYCPLRQTKTNIWKIRLLKINIMEFTEVLECLNVKPNITNIKARDNFIRCHLSSFFLKMYFIS